MSKIYASFSDPSLAERATGALLDYGALPEDISLLRGGQDEDLKNWERDRTQTTYGEVDSMSSENTVAGEYSPEANRPDAIRDPSFARSDSDMMDRSDPNYIYENKSRDADLNDPQYRAAERVASADYVENREEMDEDLEKAQKNDLSAKSGLSTTTGGDAAAGAAKGAGVGVVVGILAGLAALFLPGIGLVIGGGALATAVGAAVGTVGAGAVAGAVTGYLKDQGVEDSVAQDYQRSLEAGGALLEVSLPSGKLDEITAREVLAKYGAANVGAVTGTGYVA